MSTNNRIAALLGRTPAQRAAAAVAGSVLAMLVAFAVQSRYRLVFQYDHSVDFRLAYVDQNKKDIDKGDYFAFRFLAVPEDSRYGQTFIKKLACLEGDHLSNVGRDFYCNGQYVGRAKEYSREGKPLPVFHYDGPVPPGLLFGVGEVPASYDSKIWGFIRQEWVVGTVHRII